MQPMPWQGMESSSKFFLESTPLHASGTWGWLPWGGGLIAYLHAPHCPKGLLCSEAGPVIKLFEGREKHCY